MTRVAQIVVLAMAMFGLGILARDVSETLAAVLGLVALAGMLVALAFIVAVAVG